MSPALLDPGDERSAALGRLVGVWLASRSWGAPGGQPTVREVEVLRSGMPGILDVLAQTDKGMAHAVFGLRRPGEEVHFLRTGDEAVVGLLEDGEGLRVVVDALHDAELAPRVLDAVAGVRAGDDPVAFVADDGDGATLAFGERCTLTVFPWVDDGPRRGVELLVALDEAGFDQLAAPLAVWRRGGRDLGLVQERLADQVGGWTVALTSLRELYASGGPPEAAQGDFAPSARALGTMTGRLHLALDRAYGRTSQAVAGWVDAVVEQVRASAPELLARPGVDEAVAALRRPGLRAPTLRTHGDLTLGRTARTARGWVLADGGPGAAPAGPAPVFRSPLADVADLLWSLHHVAGVAATERDPTDRSGGAAVARAWEQRNRRAFLSGYLATPGVGGLVPGGRQVVANLAAVFELERAAARTGH